MHCLLEGGTIRLLLLANSQNNRARRFFFLSSQADSATTTLTGFSAREPHSTVNRQNSFWIASPAPSQLPICAHIGTKASKFLL